MRAQASTAPRHQISTAACDSCRRKKSKCEPEASLGHRYTGGEVRGDCRACRSVGISCTFELPVKKRGPAKGSKTSTSKGLRRHEEGLQLVQSPGASLSPSQESWTPAVNVYTSPVIQQWPAFRTDEIFRRSTYRGLIQSYLDLVYPTVPLVHRPSFLQDLEQNRDIHDDIFLSLTLSICAVTAALIPRKFKEFQNSPDSLRFQTRTQMIEACCKLVVDLRPPDYFDVANLSKWATAYMFQTAYFQVGLVNRTSFWTLESAQMARILRLEDPSNVAGVNCIETQLRKKAFWLTFFPFVYQNLGVGNIPFLPLYDKDTFDAIRIENLWPIEVDDEYISDDVVLSQPADTPSLTTGFNAGARLFWLACTRQLAGSDRRILVASTRTGFAPSDGIESLKSRIEDLKAANDDLDEMLGQWSTNTDEPSAHTSQHLLEVQIESLRANIQVTRLWLQSTLFEDLAAIETTAQMSEYASHQHKKTWDYREEICLQLLSVLQNIRQSSLEPNGNSLTSKIREVAATLLNCPFEQQGMVARRANTYLNSFVNILTRLDHTEHKEHFTLDTQAWCDLHTLSEEVGWTAPWS